MKADRKIEKKVAKGRDKMEGKLTNRIRTNLVIVCLMMAGLLITVNAIHAYEEANVEKKVAVDLANEVEEGVTAGATDEATSRADEVTDRGSKVGVADDSSSGGETVTTEETRDGILEWVANKILGESIDNPCEVCGDGHHENCEAMNLEGSVDGEVCTLCLENQEGECEQCARWSCLCCKDCVRCEQCLACVNCLKCENCGECFDCAGCESCSGCEDCLKCENCETEWSYQEWQLPKIEASDPDGNNGYYRSVPEIKISHQLERVSVHYRWTDGRGVSIEGVVPGVDYTVEEEFTQGENVLEVWVELPDKTWNERRIFILDSVAPQRPSLSFNQSLVNGNVYSGEGVRLSFESFDEGSGIDGYYYKIGNSEESFIPGDRGELVITHEFAGRVEVVAVDVAGNKSEMVISPLIIVDKNRPIISILSDSDLSSWNHSGINIEVKVEEWGISSGIEGVRVLLDEEIILERNFNQSEKVYFVRNIIPIEKNSLNGQGLNLRVEARDNVGNETVTSQSLFIDTKDPSLDFLDAFDRMIIGSDRTIEIAIEDENLLSDYQVNVRHSTFEGEESESVLQGEISSTSQMVYVNLEQEGRFVIEALARDISGREVRASLNVILDKTSPIIQYVEQLNGKHIPFFQWNYQSEDMIHDVLDFQHQMLLNSNLYRRGTLVESEGDYIFQVIARDEAGNESQAHASFVIDNTPPEIYFYNINHGESYEEEVMAGIAVTGTGERIKRIEVNGERASIDSNTQMVQLRFSQVDDYTILIEADDLAGNVSVEEISFAITKTVEESSENMRGKPGNAMKRVAEKVGAILPDGMASAIVNAVESGSMMMKLVIGVGVLLGTSGAGFFIYKKVGRRAK